MRKYLYLLVLSTPWATSTMLALTTEAAALAPRQQTMILADFSYWVTTIISTALDGAGNPKSRTVFNVVAPTKGGPASFKTNFVTELDVTTFVTTTRTSSFDVYSILPTLYFTYPTTLSSGTNTFRVESKSTVYTVTESTVMNGPVVSMTILTTQTATIAKGGTGFTTRTDVLSKPIISTFSVPILTASAVGLHTITMNADGPITTTPPSTLLTHPSSSQASTVPTSSSTSSPNAVATKSSPSKTVIIAVVVSLLAVVALAGLGYWFWRRRKAQKKKISQPTNVVRMIQKPQDAFNSPAPPQATQPIRSDTVTSRQASSDLPSGPYYNYTGTSRDDSSYIRPEASSVRPSYQSYTESDYALLRPQRPETLNTDLREFMNSPEPGSNDYAEFIAQTEREAKEKQKEADKILLSRLNAREAAELREIERIRRQQSAENVHIKAENERQEELDRARRFQMQKDELDRKVEPESMAPPPLNIVKKKYEQKFLHVEEQHPYEPDVSHYGSVTSDGFGGKVDVRPYSPSEYETIIPDSSGSESSPKKGKLSTGRERISQNSAREEVIAMPAMPPTGNRDFDFHDDSDESDEEKKARERRVKERREKTGDTRESIYSQGTTVDNWNTYNRGMNLDSYHQSRR